MRVLPGAPPLLLQGVRLEDCFLNGVCNERNISFDTL
jgi:hypothetical protein